MAKRIIVNGRGGSGKDELADYLVEKHGFTKIAFADGIYEIARRYFGMKYKDRYLLQRIGQKMREVKNTIWIDYTMSKIENLDRVVISDLRQSNEYQIALEHGFLPIRVSADLNKRIERIEKRDGMYPDLKLLENESETGADDYTYLEIDNNGSVEDLHRLIDEIMSMDSIDDYIKQLQYELMMKQMY